MQDRTQLALHGGECCVDVEGGDEGGCRRAEPQHPGDCRAWHQCHSVRLFQGAIDLIEDRESFGAKEFHSGQVDDHAVMPAEGVSNANEQIVGVRCIDVADER